MDRAGRPRVTPHAMRLAAVGVLFSACAVRDLPAGAGDCEYRCVAICPPGFQCRDGFCVRPEFLGTCTPGEDDPAADGSGDRTESAGDAGPDSARGADAGTDSAQPACRAGDGLLTISALPSLQACTGQAIEVPLEVGGGDGPFHWFATSLAPGLELVQDNTRRALLRGTLKDAGSFQVAIGVRDARNCAQLSVPVSVAETPRITLSWPDACTDTPFELTLTATGGDPSTYSWSYRGEPALDQMSERLYGRTPAEAGSYPVRVTLRDAHCPVAGADPLTEEQVWTVRAPGECPVIVSSGLPAPCQGIRYSQALSASGGSGTGYTWSSASGQLPSGLEFFPDRGVIEGTPSGVSRTGSLELLLTDSLGQRASATLDLTLREQCRMAWIADEPARLHLGDVFLSDEGLTLPEQLDSGARVLDMKFSPDGAWLAFRAGVPGAERLHLHALSSSAGDALMDFACPDANACAVLDYAWSRDAQHLAVVLGDGTSQDFVSGLSIAQGGALATWPVIASALSDVTEVTLDYLRDLSWAPGGYFGFVGASGLEGGKPHGVFMAQAGLPSLPQAGVYYDRDLRLRQKPSGWVAYDGFTYKATAILPPSDAATHAAAWTSPSGEYVATTDEGRLAIAAMDQLGPALATTDPGSCAVVAAWAPRSHGMERILCSGGSIDVPDGTALRVFDFDLARQVFDPPAGRAIPLNGLFSPAPLNNTRRMFTASADWLVLGAPDPGVTLTSVPFENVDLPRPLVQLSVNAPAEMSFSPDGRSLLIYDRAGLIWRPVPASAFYSRLSLDGSNQPMTPPSLVPCEEALWASPDKWCGAPSSAAHFLISSDSRSVLFEADGALWVSDLGIARDLPPRRVASLPGACAASCSGSSYVFVP